MKLLKRIGFYLIGVAIGSILVLFIWEGKDVSFNYGMDVRTLSSIRKKQLIYSEDASQAMIRYGLDTLTVNAILNNGGDIDFGKSKARQEPCPEYYITGKNSNLGIHLYVKRCDSVATVLKIEKMP